MNVPLPSNNNTYNIFLHMLWSLKAYFYLTQSIQCVEYEKAFCSFFFKCISNLCCLLHQLQIEPEKSHSEFEINAGVLALVLLILMEFGKGWEEESGDMGEGQEKHEHAFISSSPQDSLSVVVPSNKRWVRNKNPAKNNTPVILSQKKTRIGTKYMDKLQFSAWGYRRERRAA